jgi:F-type H+-transporting ATPase subunit gamma
VESLEQLRRRIEAFDDLAGIVRTMKSLAAVGVRQYERAVQSLAVYYRTVELGLHVVLRDVPPQSPGHEPRELAAVVFGSDHGLCGRFNEDMADYVRERLEEAAGAGETPRLLAVGARVASRLESAGLPVEEEMPVPGSAERITDTVRRILLKVDAWRSQGGSQRLYLFHNRPLSGSRYHPTGVQVLPVDVHRFHRLEEERWPSRSLPMYTMERDRLLAALLRQYFFVSIFRASAESLAAENASRLAAMQAAEKNLADRHEELVGALRRQRQDAITAELLDIVSGYEVSQADSGLEPPG